MRTDNNTVVYGQYIDYLIVQLAVSHTERKRCSKCPCFSSADHLLPSVTSSYRTHTPPPALCHNLHPPHTNPPHTLPTPSLPPHHLPRRSHSVDALDSMIIVQYVENDVVNTGQDNSTDYHHLAGRYGYRI